MNISPCCADTDSATSSESESNAVKATDSLNAAKVYIKIDIKYPDQDCTLFKSASEMYLLGWVALGVTLLMSSGNFNHFVFIWDI